MEERGRVDVTQTELIQIQPEDKRRGCSMRVAAQIQERITTERKNSMTRASSAKEQ
ncbi:hypothetical protein RchiOBHm_Chr7g0231751 [Rosa chinensis]|uniref:Uncharacterized protein n=1 Tax=Rosa chinensis TaxID=74649 RepID=A0A2P6PFR1_ROSCH|nr:hypothetical protein RchiOBHm_Chr7g0231751 [Rosa chinensis]